MCCMSPCELVSFVTAVACSISNCCDEDEIAVLAAVFTQLGDTLETLSVQKDICQKESQEGSTKLAVLNSKREEEVTERNQ